MRIVIIVSCIIVLVFLFLTIQVPVIDVEKVDQVINDVQSTTEVIVEDEETLKNIVIQITKQLEKDQQTRLKYLVSAYLIIWLVFMLYLLRLGKQHRALDQRLSQFEQGTSTSDSADES